MLNYRIAAVLACFSCMAWGIGANEVAPKIKGKSFPKLQGSWTYSEVLNAALGFTGNGQVDTDGHGTAMASLIAEAKKNPDYVVLS